MASTYESVLCVKNEVMIYKIPPRPSNRGYRAADWKLDQPDWKGRLRIVAKGNDCIIKLEDKSSGELFAQCPVDAHPGIAVEAVMDSSRYFVIRLVNDNGQNAFIGMGFADRADSFDFNVAIQDHFKWVKQTKQLAEEEKKAQLDPGPKLDLGFKEGQTIKINLGGGGNKKTGVSRPKPSGGAAPGFLPPPPGSKIPTLTPPPGQAGQWQQPQPVVQQPVVPPQQTNMDLLGGFPSQPPSSSNQDLLGDLGSFSTQPSSTVSSSSQPKAEIDIFGDFTAAPTQQQQQQQQQPMGGSDWGDFTSAGNQPPQGGGGGGWVQF